MFGTTEIYFENYQAKVDKQIADMLFQGVVQPSTSPWASPVIPVNKKDGSFCFCIDYRTVNAITKNDINPLPRVDACQLPLGIIENSVYL